jgi:hypothetical protein|tara:strand:- start:4169 stop:4612 length:444 start_codon:yes stop_codon:yes gene_type:complete
MYFILKNSIYFSIILLVLLVSTGFNISKMTCDKSQSIYLGSEVPNCMVINTNTCNKDSDTPACCRIVEKKCCPTNMTGSCDKESVFVQLDFETIFSYVKKINQFSTIIIYDNRLYTHYVNVKKIIKKYGLSPPPTLGDIIQITPLRI